MIEHLAISGAGPAGIIQVGMIQQALAEGVFSLDNIKSYHGSSAGAIISLLLCIRVSIQELVDYVVLRPWEKWIMYDIPHFYNNKGLVSSDCFISFVSPFFHAYNIPLDITLKELYDRTGIDLYIYTTKMSSLESIALHHINHPDLKAIQCIMMSANMPILFTPVKYKNEYYIDGALRSHCPLILFPEDTVLNIYISYQPSLLNIEDTKDYFSHLCLTMFYIVCNNSVPPKGHLIQYNEHSMVNINSWKKGIYDETYRREMIDIGKQCTQSYIEKQYHVDLCTEKIKNDPLEK